MKTSRLCLVGLAWVASVVLVSAQKIHPALIRNHPAIAYATAPVSDPVALLNERLRRGEVTLEKNEHSGYLPSVLSALGVSIDSQVLVFCTHDPVEYVAFSAWSERRRAPANENSVAA